METKTRNKLFITIFIAMLIKIAYLSRQQSESEANKSEANKSEVSNITFAPCTTYDTISVMLLTIKQGDELKSTLGYRVENSFNYSFVKYLDLYKNDISKTIDIIDYIKIKNNEADIQHRR
jgi:hypothetical protein